jgi:hypothetical protein
MCDGFAFLSVLVFTSLTFRERRANMIWFRIMWMELAKKRSEKIRVWIGLTLTFYWSEICGGKRRKRFSGI